MFFIKQTTETENIWKKGDNAPLLTKVAIILATENREEPALRPYGHFVYTAASFSQA